MDWGHQFLYDGEMLKMTMAEAGFVAAQPSSGCIYGESEHLELQGIEQHGKHPGYPGSSPEDGEAVKFETMVFEGTRP